MNTARHEIDPYPVAALRDRYNLGNQAVYNRLEAVSVKPTKIGKRSFITLEELEALDKLHKHISAGGTMANFQSQPIQRIQSLPSQITSNAIANDNDIITLIERITTALSPKEKLLDNLRELESAAKNNWLLTTQEVKALIGVKPKGETIQRGTFIFMRSGKIGNQIAWRVSKKFPTI